MVSHNPWQLFFMRSLSMYAKTRRGVGRGQGRGFLYRQRGGSCARMGPRRGSWGSCWAGREGGFLCTTGGFLCTFCILLVPIMPIHLLAGLNLYIMQKAVATFVHIVCRVTAYWELRAAARHHRLKFLQLVVGTVLGDEDISLRSDNSAVIEFSKMHDLQDGGANFATLVRGTSLALKGERRMIPRKGGLDTPTKMSWSCKAKVADDNCGGCLWCQNTCIGTITSPGGGGGKGSTLCGWEPPRELLPRPFVDVSANPS